MSPLLPDTRSGRFLGALLLILGTGAAGLSAKSAAAQITVRGELAHDFETAPGTSLSGRIEIMNESDDIQEVRAYLMDYSFRADGTNSYESPGSAPRSNASWITFSPQTTAIPGGEAIEIAYKIDVPAAIEQSSGTGSYWSILMVEAVDPTSSESSLSDEAPSAPAVGFRQVTRYGIQLATHVGAATTEVALEGIRLVSDESGQVSFSADIVNTGERMIRPDVYLRLFDASGREFGPFDGMRFRIYPGTSVRQVIALEDVPTGDFTALLVVDGGADHVFGGQYELTL